MIFSAYHGFIGKLLHHKLRSICISYLWISEMKASQRQEVCPTDDFPSHDISSTEAQQAVRRDHVCVALVPPYYVLFFFPTTSLCPNSTYLSKFSSNGTSSDLTSLYRSFFLPWKNHSVFFKIFLFFCSILQSFIRVLSLITENRDNCSNLPLLKKEKKEERK